MEYSKNPLTYDEQADLLISRGLQVDREYLIQILKNVNYYRLTGYLYPFRKNFGEKDEFLEDTSFSTVWRHYTFDRQIKLLLLDAIESAYYGRIRTLIPVTSGQRNGIIRTP